MNEDLMKLEGLDEAVIGACLTWNKDELAERVIYDGNKIVELLTTDGEMSTEEAHEYIDFNIIGAYQGPETPIVMWPATAEQLDERT